MDNKHKKRCVHKRESFVRKYKFFAVIKRTPEGFCGVWLRIFMYLFNILKIEFRNKLHGEILLFSEI